MQAYTKQRLLLLDDDFRKSAVWGFRMLDRFIENELYSRHKKCKAAALSNATAPPSKPPLQGEDDARASGGEDGGQELATKRRRDVYAELF